LIQQILIQQILIQQILIQQILIQQILVQQINPFCILAILLLLSRFLHDKLLLKRD
jgi:hypothetical protein